MAKKGNNGGGASKTYDPAEEAVARKAAQERKKRAAGHSDVHNVRGLNQGLKGIARREHERKLQLADKRAEQADAAMGMMPELLSDDFGPAHQAFAAVVTQFRTAQPRRAQNGNRIGATQVAVEKARAADPHLFRLMSAEEGVRAAKKALWRAGTPDREKVEARDRAASRRSQNRRKPAVTVKKTVAPASPEQIKKLRDAVAAAQLDANLAKAALPVNGKRMSSKVADDRLAAAEQALASATAA